MAGRAVTGCGGSGAGSTTGGDVVMGWGGIGLGYVWIGGGMQDGSRTVGVEEHNG